MIGSAKDYQQPLQQPAKRWPRWLALLGGASRLVLAAVFLMAAITKIIDLPAFENQVVQHGGLSSTFAGVVVWILPWLELTCGVCLGLGYAHREAGLITAALLILFSVHRLITMEQPECGCFLFPPLRQITWTGWPLVRNLLLLLCNALVLFRPAEEATKRA